MKYRRFLLAVIAAFSFLLLAMSQPIAMEPVIEGEGNAPTVDWGNNLHLEVLKRIFY
ncbi:MAG: hypothetical protein AAGU27_19355 [Dehalobacterium sp.]